MINELRRQLLAAGAGFIVTFDVCLTYWMIEEAQRPGQQYADPLLPCAFVASLGAQVGLVVCGGAGIAALHLIRRRQVPDAAVGPGSSRPAAHAHGGTDASLPDGSCSDTHVDREE